MYSVQLHERKDIRLVQTGFTVGNRCFSEDDQSGERGGDLRAEPRCRSHVVDQFQLFLCTTESRRPRLGYSDSTYST